MNKEEKEKEEREKENAKSGDLWSYSYDVFKAETHIYRLRQLCLLYTFLEPVLGDKTHEIEEIKIIIGRIQENLKRF